MGGATMDFSSASPRLHAQPIVCHLKVTDLSLFSFPTSVKWAHYINNITLTREDLPLLQGTLQILLEHLQGTGEVLNQQKIQGSGTTIKFLGIILLGKV